MGANNFLESFVEFDNHIFKKASDNGKTYFGQFYVAELNPNLPIPKYALSVLLNSTS
jgi:hypothetical protein